MINAFLPGLLRGLKKVKLVMCYHCAWNVVDTQEMLYIQQCTMSKKQPGSPNSRTQSCSLSTDGRVEPPESHVI